MRLGYQSASAFAGGGPDIIYGPMDQVGPFEAMHIIKPLEDVFSDDYFQQFNPLAVVRYKGHIYQIADRLGNHLAL